MDTFSYLVPQCKTKETLHEIKEKKKKINGLVSELEPIQTRMKELLNSPIIDEVLDRGALAANKLAFKKVKKVEHKMGLGRKK